MDDNDNLDKHIVNESEFIEILTCAICTCIFTNPTRLECSHTFCHSCITSWLKSNKSCPHCRKKFTNNVKYGRDLIAESIINKLDVKCYNYQCPWKGKLEDLEKHKKNCFFSSKNYNNTKSASQGSISSRNNVINTNIISNLSISNNDLALNENNSNNIKLNESFKDEYSKITDFDLRHMDLKSRVNFKNMLKNGVDKFKENANKTDFTENIDILDDLLKIYPKKNKKSLKNKNHYEHTNSLNKYIEENEYDDEHGDYENENDNLNEFDHLEKLKNHDQAVIADVKIDIKKEIDKNFYHNKYYDSNKLSNITNSNNSNHKSNPNSNIVISKDVNENEENGNFDLIDEHFASMAENIIEEREIKNVSNLEFNQFNLINHRFPNIINSNISNQFNAKNNSICGNNDSLNLSNHNSNPNQFTFNKFNQRESIKDKNDNKIIVEANNNDDDDNDDIMNDDKNNVILANNSNVNLSNIRQNNVDNEFQLRVDNCFQNQNLVNDEISVNLNANNNCECRLQDDIKNYDFVYGDFL